VWASSSGVVLFDFSVGESMYRVGIVSSYSGK